MKLQEKIKTDRMTAMKNGEKSTTLLLGTLLGELNRIDKVVSDEIVIKTIKKMMDSNKEVGGESLLENDILELYLPKVLSNKELNDIIKKVITENGYSGMKDMGKIMKVLSENYLGRYDGKEASEIVKNSI